MKLKIAAITNILLAIGFLMTGMGHVPITRIAFLLITALFFYDTDRRNVELERKVPLIVIGIVTIPINFVASILVFLTVYMNKEKVEKEKVSKEVRRLDILLKLGAFMIVVSGIILSSSNIEGISDPMKVIILILISILMFGLSYFSEVRLKIKRTIETYFNLSLIFFVLAFITAGHFRMFGENFTLGSDLFGGTLFLLISLCLLASGLKFKKDGYKYSGLVTAFLSLFIYLGHFNLSFDTKYISLLLILVSLNYFNKQEVIRKFLVASAIFVAPLIYLLNVSNFDNLIILLFTVGLLNIGLYYEHVKDSSSEYKSIFVSFFTLLILFASVLVINEIDINQKMLVITLIYSAVFIKTIFINLNSMLVKHLRYFVNAGFVLILLLSNFNETLTASNINNLIITSSILVTNLLFVLFDNKDFKIEHYLQPAKFTLFLYFALLVLNIDINVILHILYFSCFVLFFIIKDTKMKLIYVTTGYILIVNSLLNQNYVHEQLSLLHILMPLLAYLYINRGEYSLKVKNALYSSLLVFIALELSIAGNVINDLFIGSIIAALALTGICIYYKSDKTKFDIARFVTIIPLISLVLNSDVNFELNIMLTRIVLLYLLYLLNITVLKEHKHKMIINIILLSLIILSMIFIQSLVIGLFVGILSLILIFVSFKFKEYNYIFYIGIVSAIINIVVQLNEQLRTIPYWAYLLFSGLLLIGIVTYIELKNQRK